MSANQENWWEQNWPWALPVGCLGVGCLGLMVVLVIIGAIGGSIFSFVSDGFKSSGPDKTYEMATERIKSDPVLIREIGGSHLDWLDR